MVPSVSATDAPFARFTPAALKSFRHPGGVPIFDSDSEGGYQNFTVTPRGGGYPFFRHIKKETEQSKISLSCNFPAALDAPFAQFAPAALISFQRPGGVPIFDSDFEGGVPNIYSDSERGLPKFYGDSRLGGGLRAFYVHFSPISTTFPNKKF